VGDPVDASENCTDTFAEGDAGENVKEAAGMDGDEGEDEDEEESPQAQITNAQNTKTDGASQARKGSARVAVMDAS
jgi:hypothetical protein